MQKDPDKTAKQGFVSRWSRLKSVVKDEAAVEEINTLNQSVSSGELVASIDPSPEYRAEKSQQPEKIVLTDKDMPTIDSLDENSDYSGFMSPGVSEALRKLALRKLFSGARFNIRDGLDDYDDDFRNFAALGDIVTCDMKHQMELEEERKRKEEEAMATEDKAKDGEERVNSKEDTGSEKPISGTPDEHNTISESDQALSDDTDANTIETSENIRETKEENETTISKR